jgi:hypothetical protein
MVEQQYLLRLYGNMFKDAVSSNKIIEVLNKLWLIITLSFQII